MTDTQTPNRDTAQERLVYSRPEALTSTPTKYCPGCTHGIVHRLVAETIDELGIRETTIGVGPVGCAVVIYNYMNFDIVESAHGRAPAVATGIKRILPDRTVFTYQGDGDLAAIGTAEIVHTAIRGENITVIFINNAIYGMTGGQMAPTTLPNQRTSSTSTGRDINRAGNPIKVAELLASQDGPAYVARTAVNTPANVARTKAAIKKAFKVQHAGLGFSLVEVLSTCPTNWGLKPVESLTWITENMIPHFPLGEHKVINAVAKMAG